MAPEASVFDAGKFRDVFCILLTLTGDEERETYSIARAYDVLKPHVPSGIFPFGKTSGGEYLCFDYRAAPEHPKVVLVTVETTIKAVASSFADFMASLHDGRAPRVSR
ncbi:SMI1/KNR4 family protein [Archangium violaceum]|uniref:SMI1/KNR4 family protein n=1 Tax=Archangium violaceum TaxID=83451 RepID=UPI0037BEE79C